MSRLAAAISVVVVGQVIYHSVARGAPVKATPYGLVAVAYAVGLGAVLVIGMTSKQLSLASLTDPAILGRGVLLGGAVALVELGYIFSYRYGLAITTGALSVLTITTVVLAPIGLLVFDESFSWRLVIGAALAVAGVWLMRV